jgi:3-hydroxyacyl-CoA dehydrogenase
VHSVSEAEMNRRLALIEPVKTYDDIAQCDVVIEAVFERISVNEACKILEEGKAYRASDIDVMWLNGFGFPRYRGGLMY